MSEHFLQKLLLAGAHTNNGDCFIAIFSPQSRRRNKNTKLKRQNSTKIVHMEVLRNWKQKLITINQTTHQTLEAVKKKENQADYHQLAQDVKNLADELNLCNQQAVQNCIR